MKTLRQSLYEYLAERREQGYKLHSASYGLLRFVSFMEKRNCNYITTELALQWAKQGSCAKNQEQARAQCLGFVREFAKYLSAKNVRAEIPPFGLLPHPARKVKSVAKPKEKHSKQSKPNSTLRQAIIEYIELRRAMGFKLHLAGKMLLRFASFMESNNAEFVTIKLAMEWAQQPANSKASTWAQHLGYVRDFAKFRISADSRTEIPPWSLLPYSCKRTQPHLYSEEEIQALLCATQNLPAWSAAGILRRHTYYCLFGLLSVTGLRISEAINLKLADIDFGAGVLTVKQSKFGKSRLVPVHATTVDVLRNYEKVRTEYLTCRGFHSEYFFVTHSGGRIDGGDIRRKFYSMSKQIGLRGEGKNIGPRIHDFRHGFAVQTILQWYRSGVDVEKKLPLLSTYLGHVKVKDTYWYLSATPELMDTAVKLLENRWGETL